MTSSTKDIHFSNAFAATGMLVNLFATPVGIANAIQKKEAWSIGSKAAGCTMFNQTTSKGADESFHEDNNG